MMLMMIVAAAGIWWFALPSATAHRFATAINQGRIEDAANLVWKANQDILLKRGEIRAAHASVKSLLNKDSLRGTRVVHLRITYGNDEHEIVFNYQLEANAVGVFLPKELRSSNYRQE